MLKKILTTFSLATFSLMTHAAPFTNGSFEDLGGQNLQYGNWGYFDSVPGWVGVDHLEVHKGNDGATFVTPQDGNYYAELNAHPAQVGSFELYQTFDTSVGQSYSLEFYARKRAANDGHFLFSVGNIVDNIVDTHMTNDWTKFSYEFTADNSFTTLGFISGQAGNDTVGHYIDNVSVSSVPEPSILALFGFGALILLAGRRRRGFLS